MCSLCGVLGGAEHWTEAAARPGVYTRNVERIDRRRERARQLVRANHVLEQFGLRISDWQGSAFVISTRTGKSEIIDALGRLWPTVERLSGKVCDPLDAQVIAHMEACRNV